MPAVLGFGAVTAPPVPPELVEMSVSWVVVLLPDVQDILPAASIVSTRLVIVAVMVSPVGWDLCPEPSGHDCQVRELWAGDENKSRDLDESGQVSASHACDCRRHS